MHIMFDVSRLLQRVQRPNLTGIDRVDLAFATHLNDTPRDVSFVLGKNRPRILAARETARFQPHLQANVAAMGEDDLDPQYRQLRDLLALPAEHWSKQASGRRLRAKKPLMTLNIKRMAEKIGQKSRARALPQDLTGVVYVNTSHSGLENAGMFGMLKARGGQIAVMVHDLIPLDYPEYCAQKEDIKHERRLMAVQAHADLVLVNSLYTRDRLNAWVEARKLRMPPIRVVPLGVAQQYFSRKSLLPPVRARDYFVTVGTIEARKNHAFLLTLWRRLAEELGDACPVLVVAGRRGWEMEAAADLLERCPQLARCVIEVEGLNDFSLASLMVGARGVLQPSLVEGFSLPVAEAQALGVPVIASDIAAHRELAAPGTILADPLDGPGWLARINDLRNNRFRQVQKPWEPLRQDEHVAAALDAMKMLALH